MNAVAQKFRPVIYRDHIILLDDNRIRVLIPHAKELEHDGQRCLLVPHGVDETQILRNIGISVPQPIMVKYDWAGDTPYDAQKITAAMITSARRSYVLNGIGTGKTRSVLYAYDALRRFTPNMGRLFITCPMSTMRQTWEREISMVFPHLRCAVLHGDKRKRLAALATSAEICIINHDGVETIFKELMAAQAEFSMFALDELSTYKNHRTDMWKATYAFTSGIDRGTGLTATPIPLAATDAYGQIRILTPEVLKGQSFTRFREEMQTKITQFKWVNKRDAVDRVHKLMQPSVRYTRDECYDLPPCQTVTRSTLLTPEQYKAFHAMQEQGACDWLNVTSANAADQINKMLQIALGVVYDKDRNPISFDIKDRIKLLEDAVQESASKVIVFTPYKHSLARLVEHLRKRWTVAEVSGDVSQTQRERIFTCFMQTPDPQIIVAHPECMSHGLTLTEASTIVWWGPPGSLETYEQANGRITRAGQRHSQLIVNLVATKLEEKVFRLLQSRSNVQQSLLDLFERQDKGDLA